MTYPLSNTLKPGMIGAFYGRVSSKKQLKGSDQQTMAAQHLSAEELVAKYGCKLEFEYTDLAISATKVKYEKRKGLNILLKDAYDKKFDFVVVSNHDRLARNPKDHQLIRQTMEFNRIPIVISSTESLYQSDEFMVDLIKDGASKFEVDNTRIRTKDTMKKIAKEGKWTGGVAPFGYTYNKRSKRFEAIDVELELVKQIFALYRKNEGFQSIAKQLAKGTYRGKNWDRYKVKYIITNPFYAGYISIHRKDEKNHQTVIMEIDQWILTESSRIRPVITLEEWKYCWNLYKERNQREIAPKQYKTNFFLKGLLYCSHCSNALETKDQRTTGKNGKVYGKRIYRCKTCDYSYEEAIVHKLITVVLNEFKTVEVQRLTNEIKRKYEEEKVVLNEERTNIKEEIHRVEDKAREIEDEIKKIIRDSDNEDKEFIRILTLSKEKYVTQKSELEKVMEEKRKRINFISNIELNESILDNKIKDMELSVEQLNKRDLRRLLLFLVEKITINNKGKVELRMKHTMKEMEI